MSKQRNKPKWHKASPYERMTELYKNGITMKDMDKAFEEGRQKGAIAASNATIKTIYAGLCLALNAEFGFGARRCLRVLHRVDQTLMETLTSEEAVQAVWDKLKLKLNFDEPFDRLEEMDASPTGLKKFRQNELPGIAAANTPDWLPERLRIGGTNLENHS